MTGSTNVDMLALARDGEPEGSWLRADRQEAGRGRHGREWRSPEGNFHGSTLVRLRPGDPPAPFLSFVAAVAAADAVGASLPPGAALSLKWPNDLLLGGGKLAGILLERAGDAVVIGIGVNLAGRPDVDRQVATIADVGVAVSPEAFGADLASAFTRWLATWRDAGAAPVLARWRERAHPLGTPLQVRGGDGGVVAGAFDGIGDDGALRLRLADGSARTIHAGDVFLAQGS